MIFIILLVVLICFCVSAVAMLRNKRFILVTLAAFAILCGSLWLIAENDTNHLGMHLTTNQTKTQLKSSYSSPLPFLVYKQLGNTNNMQERVYSYRRDDQSKHYQTKHKNFKVRVVKQSKQVDHAQLVTTVMHYQFNNRFWHILFLGTQTKRRQRTTYVFKVPQSWLVLESKQAKKLPKAAKRLQKTATLAAQHEIKQQVTNLIAQQVKSQAPAAIAQQLKAKVNADPALAANQTQFAVLQQQVTKSVTTDLTTQATKNVKKNDLPKIKQEVLTKNKTDVVRKLRTELQ